MNLEMRKSIRLFLRRHRGGQGELARMLGVSQSFLSQWLRGEATSQRLEAEIPACMEELEQRMLRRGLGGAQGVVTHGAR